MTFLAPILDDKTPIGQDAAPAPLWKRFLHRFAGAARTGSAAPSPPATRRAVCRISRVWVNRWVVTLPEKTLGHVFESAAEAEAFLREACGDKPMMVEIEIGELYVAARIEPNRPLLFRAGR